MRSSPTRIPHVCGGEPSRVDIEVDVDIVFPTYVGVNRLMFIREAIWLGIPHVCGGEPNSHRGDARMVYVFPTYVGVNRVSPL